DLMDHPRHSAVRRGDAVCPRNGSPPKSLSRVVAHGAPANGDAIMPHPLQVLILESAGGGAGRIVEALKESGFEPAVREAHDAAEFRAALGPLPEVVIAGAGYSRVECLRALQHL